jgi:hypothetical protein
MNLLKKDLEGNKTFILHATVSTKNWLIVMVFLLSGFITLFNSYPIIISIFIFILTVGFFIFNLSRFSDKLIIGPNSVIWRRNIKPREVKFVEINHIEFYKPTQNLDLISFDTEVIARFILKNGTSYTENIKRWKTPGYIKSEIYIKTILEYFFVMQYFFENPEKADYYLKE